MRRFVGGFLALFVLVGFLAGATLVEFGHDLQGPTGHRPTNVEIGQPYFDTDLGKQLYWNGSAWQSAGGAGDVSSVAFTIAKGGSSNICLVTAQLNDVNGNAVTAPVIVDVFLSDSAAGAGLTATTASGAVAAGAGGGADFGTLTSKKALRSQANASGTYQLSITDTAKTGFYVGVQVGSKVFVSRQLVTGDYD